MLERIIKKSSGNYTTGDALLSIVRVGALHATQVSCLNDSTEGIVGRKITQDAFIPHSNTKHQIQEEAYLLERIIKNIVEEPIHRPIFKARFLLPVSKEKDDWSQWRAYSGGEMDAIAFSLVLSSTEGSCDTCQL